MTGWPTEHVSIHWIISRIKVFNAVQTREKAQQCHTTKYPPQQNKMPIYNRKQRMRIREKALFWQKKKLYFKYFTWKLYIWTKALKFTRTRWRWLLLSLCCGSVRFGTFQQLQLTCTRQQLVSVQQQDPSFLPSLPYSDCALAWALASQTQEPFSVRHGNTALWDLHGTSLQPLLWLRRARQFLVEPQLGTGQQRGQPED